MRHPIVSWFLSAASALAVVLAIPPMSKADFIVQLMDGGDSITIDGSTGGIIKTGAATGPTTISIISPTEISVAGLSVGAVSISSIDVKVSATTALTYTTLQATGANTTLNVYTNSVYFPGSPGVADVLKSTVTNNSTPGGGLIAPSGNLQSSVNTADLPYLAGFAGSTPPPPTYTVPGGSNTAPASGPIEPIAYGGTGVNLQSTTFTPTGSFTLGTDLAIGFAGGPSQSANMTVTDVFAGTDVPVSGTPAPSSLIMACSALAVFAPLWMIRRRRSLTLATA